MRSSTATGVFKLEVEVPVRETVDEWYLEVREAVRGKLVTVIEVLSPTNKVHEPGRKKYRKIRDKILDSKTSMIEIDLLRAGKPMPMTIAQPMQSDYRILVSRSARRPQATLYALGLRQPIPAVPIPLLPRESEPTLDLNRVLHDLYDRARFDLRLNYATPAPPPDVERGVGAWIASGAKSFFSRVMGTR